MASNAFVRLSSVLTGEQSLDDRIAAKLEQRIKAHYAVELKAFIDAFDALPAGGDSVAQLRTLLDTQTKHNGLARAIVRAWYTGEFNTPYEIADAPQTPEEYADGLLWKVIGAHAPGFTNAGYGAWA